MTSDHAVNCSCYDCRLHTAHRDNIDFNDMEIWLTEQLGRVTGNPVAVQSAQSAKQIKALAKKEVDRVKAGGTTQWKGLPKDGTVPNVKPEDVAPEGVTVDWLGWFGPFKWILIAALVTILVAVFIRISGK